MPLKILFTNYFKEYLAEFDKTIQKQKQPDSLSGVVHEAESHWSDSEEKERSDVERGSALGR